MKNINPIKVYANALLDKPNMLSDNSKMSAVYRWVNNTNKKTYIGSSINLQGRLYKYYSEKHLKEHTTPIHNALLKYGYMNFSFEILEYVEHYDNVIEREQYYLDLLEPEYNVLTHAGSSLGFKHSEETLALFKTRVVSDETRENLSQAATGRILGEELKSKLSALKLGSKITDEHKSRISESITKLLGKSVRVENIENGMTSEYINLTEAAKDLGVSRTAVSNCAGTGNKLKNKYIINYLNKKD